MFSRSSRRLGCFGSSMAKLSVSLPDELVRDLRAVAPDNVSAFVAAAVRHELDRRRLHEAGRTGSA
jgi:metal-responsive CopG/Arc/MetJ family transcriptional regulator